MHRIILFILLFFLAKNIFSQDTLNSKTVENKSYQLYQTKNWKELISFGNTALDKGFDYYYLRMRIGTAYYEQKNYRSAQKHFWKAYQFNSTDDVLMEYLYYCCIFNAQYDEARKLSKKFSPSLANKLKTDSSPVIEYINIEGGTKAPSLDSTSNAYYGQFGLGHRIGKNISFFHAATFFSQKSAVANLNQKQYYVSINILIKKSWLITPAFHLVNRITIYNPPPKQKSSHPWMPQPPQQPLPPPPSTVNYYVGSLSIMKSIAKFDIGIGSTYSAIGNFNQVQGNISLSYFPFGNNKLFLTSIGYTQKDSASSNFEYSFSQSIFATPFSKLIVSASYLYNQSQHLVEMNCYLPKNSADITNSRIAFMSTFVISIHVNFYLLYQFENKSEIILRNNTTINYTYNNFIGGLKLIL